MMPRFERGKGREVWLPSAEWPAETTPAIQDRLRTYDYWAAVPPACWSTMSEARLSGDARQAMRTCSTGISIIPGIPLPDVDPDVPESAEAVPVVPAVVVVSVEVVLLASADAVVSAGSVDDPLVPDVAAAVSLVDVSVAAEALSLVSVAVDVPEAVPDPAVSEEAVVDVLAPSAAAEPVPSIPASRWAAL
jgi:hypothetical protein